MTFTRAFFFITLAYIAMALLIAAFMDPSATFGHAADGFSWRMPAIALYEHGTFRVPGHPELYFYRSPGVHVFFAALMFLAGGVSAHAIVVGQLCALYLSGVIFRMSVKDWFPGYEDLGMALVLFDPNLVGMAYLAQSETLATLVGMIVFYFLLKYAKGNTSWPIVIALGASLGLTCLVRANLIYLIYLLPLILPLISLVQKHAVTFWRAFGKGAIAMLAAAIIVAPLTLRIYEITGQVGWSALVTPEAEHNVIIDQFTHLEATHSKIVNGAANKKIATEFKDDFIRSYGPDWNKLSQNEQYTLLKDHYLHMMIGYPLKDWAEAFGFSCFQYFFGGGAGSWHALFGVFAEKQTDIFAETPKTSPLLFIRRVVMAAPVSALMLSAICFAYVLLARAAMVVGVIEMVRQRMWGLLLISWSTIIYFALSMLFNGQARYRAGIVGAFTILAVPGFKFVWERWKGRSGFRGASVPAAEPG